MLNWDDYNESEAKQKVQPPIQEEQKEKVETKIEEKEEITTEYTPVAAGERAQQAKEAVEELDTKEGEEELERATQSARGSAAARRGESNFGR